MDGFLLHGCRFWTFKDDFRFHPDRLIIRLCRAHFRYEWIVIPPWSHWIFGLSEKNCMKQKPPAAVFGILPVLPIISIQHGRRIFNKSGKRLYFRRQILYFSRKKTTAAFFPCIGLKAAVIISVKCYRSVQKITAMKY